MNTSLEELEKRNTPDALSSQIDDFSDKDNYGNPGNHRTRGKM
jgi:hypothetical protein